MSVNVRPTRVPLTPDKIAGGIDQCIQSAHDLYLSGVILHHQGVATIARALLILAVEEYGKVGWLYRALLLPEKSPSEWKAWWQMFTSHVIKNEVGRMMMTHGDSLLPLLTRFFRDRFPYFSIAPLALDQQKQAMLYVDFDAKSGEPIAPRKYAERHGIENILLIEEVERLVRYVAHNKSAGVFHPDVVAAYGRLNEIARDEGKRVDLLRLFYGLILKRPTDLVGEKPLDEVAEQVRQQHPREANDLIAEWSDLGRRLAFLSRD